MSYSAFSKIKNAFSNNHFYNDVITRTQLIISFANVITLVMLDQIFKYLVEAKITKDIVVIPSILDITYLKNTGAAFGMASGANYILAIITSLICIAIVAYVVFEYVHKKPISRSLFLILAGGIGNLIDRIFRGYVVDYVATPFIATFNYADAMIVIGTFWLMFVELYSAYKESKNKESK